MQNHNLLQKKLCVFDLDITISVDFLEECLFQSVPKIQYDQIFKKFFKGIENWPTIVENLVQKYPPKMQSLVNWAEKVQIVQGIKPLLLYLQKLNYQIILITGCNKFLAKKFLEHKQINECFTAVFGNQLIFDQQLNKFLYLKTTSKCNLPICNHGFCKGISLRSYLEQNSFNKIYYFGDGYNDLCGINCIQEGIAFIRKQYSLHKKLQESNFHREYINCETFFWTNGYQIIQYLQKVKQTKKIQIQMI